ncbi:MULTISPECIES: flagellar protein FlgN [Geobacillus]|uniref:flagellar protein FlgN n=1 Tax=Geobacillus TaxID=129337 RepID=UPI0009C040BD|nr:flagellar protein FlgN [Geobacillus sp. 46C-IIa]OQP07655.1 flagellar biosynthesis protein FlgN [Geobacillus sp. 46C-IIa]QNU28185.1 flagellar protein FlgN [Geobacillus sp. 46C-IIa]
MTFAELIHLLRAHVELHGSLLALARRKTEALKKNDIGSLSALLADEQKHLFAIRQLEERRRRWLKEKLGDETATIAACQAMAKGEERQQLRECGERLMAAVNALAEANELNRQLIEQSLQFVTAMIETFAPTPSTYSRTQEYAPSPDRPLFESKA